MKNAKKKSDFTSLFSHLHTPVIDICIRHSLTSDNLKKTVPKFNTGRGFGRRFTAFQECDLKHTEAFKVSEESTVSDLTDEINLVIFYT